MKGVRQISRLVLGLRESVADLRGVLAEVVDAINHQESIHVVSLTDLDGPGDAGAPVGGGDHTHVYHEVPSGSGYGPYTLAGTPNSATEIATVNGLRQKRVGAGPGLNEYYMVAANQITFGWNVSGAYICVDYQTGVAVDHVHVIGEAISGTGTTVYLLATPQVGTEVLFMNLVRLRRLPSGSPGLNEYTISGNAVTLAAPGKQSGDYMTADYLT